MKSSSLFQALGQWPGIIENGGRNVQRVGSAIHRISHYPVNYLNTYTLDSVTRPNELNPGLSGILSTLLRIHKPARHIGDEALV